MGFKENAEVVKKFFDDNKLPYQIDERASVVVFNGVIGGFSGLYKSYRFTLVVGETDIQNFSYFPAHSTDSVGAVAQFVAMANLRLAFGGFLLDCSTGEIRFHVAFPAHAVCNAPDERTRDASMQFLLFVPAQIMAASAKGLNMVMTGAVSPAEAFATCEYSTLAKQEEQQHG